MNTIQNNIDSIKHNAFNIDSSNTIAIATTAQVGNETIEVGSDIHSNSSNNDLIGVGITVIVSIIIFLLGFIINEAMRRRNKSNELSQYKQFIKEWVEKSEVTLSEYIKSLKQFSDAIKVNTDLNIAQWRTTLIHVSRINSIPLEMYSQIFIFGLKENNGEENRKQLMNLLYQINYLEKIHTIIKEAYNEYCDENKNIMKEWNMSYMQLNDLFQEHNNIDGSKFEGKIIMELMRLFIPLLETSSKGKFIGTTTWLDGFITPALSILSNERCSNYPVLLQIIRLVKSLRIAIIKHDNLNKYSYVFNEYIDSLTNAKNIINTSIEYFNDKNIKYWCQ